MIKKNRTTTIIQYYKYLIYFLFICPMQINIFKKKYLENIKLLIPYSNFHFVNLNNKYHLLCTPLLIK